MRALDEDIAEQDHRAAALKPAVLRHHLEHEEVDADDSERDFDDDPAYIDKQPCFGKSHRT